LAFLSLKLILKLMRKAVEALEKIVPK